MADKVTRNYKVAASGLLSIDEDGRIYVSVEEKGDIALDVLLEDFNGKAIKLSVSYDEDYECISIDAETGEVI
jgi:hypothetical protein